MPVKPKSDEARYKLPARDWARFAGRQLKNVRQQGRLYELPFDGDTIDIRELAKSLHDFLARNAKKLARPGRASRTSPALEKFRRERARLAELDRMEREGELVPLAGIQRLHNIEAELLRRAIERLELRYGADAAQLIRDTLDDVQATFIGELNGDKPKQE
jgi:hypothetical protein